LVALLSSAQQWDWSEKNGGGAAAAFGSGRQAAQAAFLRNLRVRRLLPDYRFRLPVVPTESFFSILRIFPVVPHAPVLRRTT
jgi:hypothetical protein